jgi:hypothetical protein
MLVSKECIRDRNGKIIGWIETDHLGNKLARDFYGKIKGRYKKTGNVTIDFYGRIVSYGDATSGLLYKK